MALSEDDLFEVEGIINEVVEELQSMATSLYDLDSFMKKDDSLHKMLEAEIKNNGFGNEDFRRLRELANIILKVKAEKVPKPIRKKKRSTVSQEMTDTINVFATEMVSLLERLEKLEEQMEEEQDFDSYSFLCSQIHTALGDDKLEALNRLLGDAGDGDVRCPK